MFVHLFTYLLSKHSLNTYSMPYPMDIGRKDVKQVCAITLRSQAQSDPELEGKKEPNPSLDYPIPSCPADAQYYLPLRVYGCLLHSNT